MRKLFGLLCLYVCSISAQTVFPGATDSAASLGEAKNRILTRLSASLSASATSATVVSGTGIVANMMMTISGTEVVWVCGVSGNTIQFGKASCPNVDGRARDNSTATTHVSGATFENRINAGYFTFMRNAVIALEAASSSGTSVSAGYYNFAAQTPGTSLLAGGVGQSITLTPCPLGVAGANTNHRLYISGGTGTAEPILITGGTCTSGAATGTITTTPVYAHSGAWTIQSATAGGQEACAVNNPCNLFYGAGTHNLYGTFWLPTGTSITGAGPAVTTLTWNNLTEKMFNAQRDRFVIRSLKLNQSGIATSGNAGIYVAGTGSAVASAVADYGSLTDLNIVGFYNGIYIAGCGGSVDLTRVSVTNSTAAGIVANAAQGYWRSVLLIGNTGNGITLGNCPSAPCGYSPFMEGIQTYNNGGWGIYATIFLQVSGLPSFFNNDFLGEIYVNLAAVSSAENGWISDSYFQFAGLSVSWGTTNTAPGILVDTDSGPITITNNHFLATQGNAINLKASLINVTNNRILGAGVGAQAGHVYGILTDATHGFNVISGNHLSVPVKLNGVYNIITDNVLYPNSALPGVYIATGTDINFSGNHIQQSGAGTAYTIDSGVTTMDGANLVTLGAATNNGNRALTSKWLNLFAPHSVGAAVASAGDISPTGEIFHVTGAAAINNILTIAGTAVGSEVCMIPDGAFTTTASGNIGRAITATVGRMVCLHFDGTDWWPNQ